MKQKIYKHLSQQDHILFRSNLYTGCGTELKKDNMFLIENDQVVHREVEYSPLLLKMFDEIILNASDHANNDKGTTKIEIVVSSEEISIKNDYTSEFGIPISKHDETGKDTLELLFGVLNSSGNYDDDEERTSAGLNGLGSKLTNIFSSKFTVVNNNDGRKQTIIWKNNMSEIVSNKTIKGKKTGSLDITFIPDFERLNMTQKINDEMKNILLWRTTEIASLSPNLKFTFNSQKIGNSFSNFVKSIAKENKYIHHNPENWNIGCIEGDLFPDNTLAYCNKIRNYSGGTHMNYVLSSISKELKTIMKKDISSLITTKLLNSNFTFIISATINKPDFPSQSKDSVTTKESLLPKLEIPKKMLTFISTVLEPILAGKNGLKEAKELKKTDGAKISKIFGIPTLQDATFAGTKKSKDCVLFLTEGLSAVAFAKVGIAHLKKRDVFGCFPLKGKLLNVRDISTQKITDNVEISSLKRIIGLQSGLDYSIDKNFNTLRYQKIVALADSDLDGVHIKGLLLNFFESQFKGLVQREGFLTQFISPAVICKKGKETLRFYSNPEYKIWQDGKSSTELNKWTIDYLKGLSSSQDTDIESYFDLYDDHLKLFDIPEDVDTLDRSFNKKRALDRKEWLQDYNSQDILEYSPTVKKIKLDDYIDKELKHFSMFDNIRSIPKLMDGMKPSQRKIIYSLLTHYKNVKKEKISTLAAGISEKTKYHHGNVSLECALVNMAQAFTGSNNIPLVQGYGNFGTRYMMGSDAGSSRYIFGSIADITRLIFNQDDIDLVTKNVDDGKEVEPEFLLPIVPLCILQTISGIGSGYSSNIPSFNIIDVIKELKKRIQREDTSTYQEINPYYKGFKGKIVKVDGIFKQKLDDCIEIDGNDITINEIPIGTSIFQFKELIEKLITEALVLDYEDLSGKNEPKFTIKTKDVMEKEDVIELLKLKKDISVSNMTLFGTDGNLKKYDSTSEIIDEFFQKRILWYQKRKDNQLRLLDNRCKELEITRDFISAIVTKQIDLSSMTNAEIKEFLEVKQWNEYQDKLLSLPIRSMTSEKIKKLDDEWSEVCEDLHVIQNTSIEDMWINDLNQLLSEL